MPSATQYTETITFRVTKATAQTLKRGAAREKRKLADWVRQLVVKELQPEKDAK